MDEPQKTNCGKEFCTDAIISLFADLSKTLDIREIIMRPSL